MPFICLPYPGGGWKRILFLYRGPYPVCRRKNRYTALQFPQYLACRITNEEQALEHAKAECAIAYTDTQVYRDITNHMWLVLFFTANTLGGCQEVYMDSSGITRLIVYGE